jgi:SulP family sulfate permease
VSSARSIRSSGRSVPRSWSGRYQRSLLHDSPLIAQSVRPSPASPIARRPSPSLLLLTRGRSARASVQFPAEGTRYLQQSASPTLPASPDLPPGELDDRLTSLRGAPFSLNGDSTLRTPLVSSSTQLPRSFSADDGEESAGSTPVRPARLSHAASEEPSGQKSMVAHDITFGLILASMEIPCMIGYAQIIFKDSFFADDMHTLLKLVLFSCMVHQASFMVASRLPFAIGSVQDAGLIFLSTMSSSIVQSCTDDSSGTSLLPGLTREDVLITTVFTLAASTLLLGVALVLTGYFRLTNLVQYLPMPVVGGYLAYIGQFCLEAAVGLMSTRSIAVDCVPLYESIAQDDCGWTKVWSGHDPVIIVVGVVLGLALMQLQHHVTHVAVFPAAMATMIGVFYAVIWIQHGSITAGTAGAREWGWLKSQPSLGGEGSGSSGVPAPADHDSPLSAWRPFLHGSIQWPAVFRCAPTWLAMYFVVAFSSCLDIAAIQMEIGRVLDFDHEIKTVGLANVLSGATGGFTGSYIFTETVFAMRNGVGSNWCGATIICCLVVCFCLPISLVTIIPSFFFGSVLCYIAAELLKEWLIESRETCSKSEYGVVWASFIAINLFGVEIGMLCGVLAQILAFVFMYARSGNLLTQRYWHSNVIRGFKQRSLTSKLHKDIVTLELHGYVFFGSATRILEAVKRCCFPSAGNVAPQDSGETPQKASNKAVKFLILDFYHVTGLDSTGAATCFLTLRQRAEELGMTLVFCHIKPRVRHLLVVQKVLPVDEEALSDEFVKEFETADEGLEWCESQLLREISSLPAPRTPSTAAAAVAAAAEPDDGTGVAEVLSAFLTQYMLPDSVAGGVMAEDIAITRGPGSQNPFGAPPRAADRHSSPSPAAAAAAVGDGAIHALGMRHRKIPSKRALSSMLVDGADESDDEETLVAAAGEVDQEVDRSIESVGAGSHERSDEGGGGGGGGGGARGRAASLSQGRDIGQFFERTVLEAGQIIYEKGDLADCMYVLERGACEVVKKPSTQQGPPKAAAADQQRGPLDPKRKLGGRRPDRGKLLRYEAGTIFGEVEFFLRHKRYFTIQAVEPGTVLHKLDWRNFDRMQRQKPQLGCAFHTAVMRWVCRWVAVDINDGRRHHGADRFLQDVDE